MKAFKDYDATDCWGQTASSSWDASRREMGIAAAQDYLASKQHPLNDFHSEPLPRWVYRAAGLACFFLMLVIWIAFVTHLRDRAQIEAVHIDCRPNPLC